MRRLSITLAVITVLSFVLAAVPARADVCIRIDEARDGLAAPDRAAALTFLARAFEQEGERVVSDQCAASYVLSHVRLGDTIVASIVGPSGRREGTAIGLDDLPRLYSQIVRSIVRRLPMGSMEVIDRTNVTTGQSEPPRRVASDGFWYARLGYSGLFGAQSYGAPAMGFGYRAEFDSYGVDFSFLNYAWQTSNSYSYLGSAPNSFSGSLLKLQGLYFANHQSNQTPYFGAGISWVPIASARVRTTARAAAFAAN